MNRSSITSSLLLHVALLLLAIFGLPSLFDKHLEQEAVISVEVLPVSAMSNVKPKTVQAPKPEQKKPEPPKKVVKEQPKPKPTPVKKEEPKPEPPKPEPPKPEPPKPEPKVEPKPEPIKEEPKEKPKPPEPKKPEPEVVKKPEPKKEPPKPKPVDDFAALEKNLEEMAKTEKAEKSEKKEDPFENLEKELSNATSNNYNPDVPLSMSEMDAVRQQFYSCWVPPVGARDLEEMNATVRIQLQADGTVTKAELVPTARYGSDGFYRAFAESAVRAVWKCNPLKHTPPKEKYDSWREMELTFNPKNMY